MRRTLMVLILAVVSTTAAAQTPAVVEGPSKTESLATVNLAEVGLAGGLTAGRVTIDPGIKRPDHTHMARTSLLVVIQGMLTEVRGAAAHEYRPGDVVTVSEGVTHHAENHGAVQVRPHDE